LRSVAILLILTDNRVIIAKLKANISITCLTNETIL
jgi:hypothetical protein